MAASCKYPLLISASRRFYTQSQTQHIQGRNAHRQKTHPRKDQPPREPLHIRLQKQHQTHTEPQCGSPYTGISHWGGAGTNAKDGEPNSFATMKEDIPLLQPRDNLQHVVMMGFGCHLGHHMRDLALLINDKRRAQNSHRLTPHEFLQPPHPVFFCNGMIRIR